jgi:hypothetical protein
MPERDFGEIFGLLRPDGWEQQQLSSGASPWSRLKSTLPGGRRLEVEFGADNTLCHFELDVAKMQPSKSCVRALNYFLLEINHHLRVARFSLNRVGYVCLSADLPVSSANVNSFRMVLGGMRAYFQQYHEEIELLSRNASVAAFKEKLIDGMLGEEITLSMQAQTFGQDPSSGRRGPGNRPDGR